MLAPITEQKRAQHEPAERDPDQDALHVVPVQGQCADAEQDDHDDEPGVDGFSPQDIEDQRSDIDQVVSEIAIEYGIFKGIFQSLGKSADLTAEGMKRLISLGKS